MKKSLTIVLLLLPFIIGSCKKDGDGKTPNTIQITQGDFNGYTHTFTPNLGFWSPVDLTVRYAHLVLGAESNTPGLQVDVMSIVFYYTGTPLIQFPSAEGQWIQFGINFEGVEYYFHDENVQLTVSRFDEYQFDGFLSGRFENINDPDQKLDITMTLSLNLQQI